MMMLMNEEQVKEYGRELGAALVPGSVVALVGELGAGKTTLAKAIAAGLGVTEPVTSPTFTLVCEYITGRLPLYHIDVYRLGRADEALPPEDISEIGFDEYLYGAGVTVVEWADRVDWLMPEGSLRLELSYTADPDLREVVLDFDPARTGISRDLLESLLNKSPGPHRLLAASPGAAQSKATEDS